MKLKEISKGIGVTLMTRVVVVEILLLDNYGSLTILPDGVDDGGWRVCRADSHPWLSAVPLPRLLRAGRSVSGRRAMQVGTDPVV